MRHLISPAARSGFLAAVALAVVLGSSAAQALDNTWNNAGGNFLYSNPANWDQGHVPTSGEVATFNGAVSNANCSIDTTISVAGFQSINAYSGTVTQALNSTMIIGGTGILWGSGTFAADATVTFNNRIDVAGSVTISGGTFTTTPDRTFIGGSFTHSGGTFNHNSGRVIFDTGSTATISGDTTWFTLECTTSNKTLRFEAGSTQTVTGTLRLRGQDRNNQLILRSTVAASTWSIDPQAGVEVEFVDVRDSTNLAAAAINPIGSIDSGNNVNWFVITELYVRPGGSGAMDGSDWDNAFATIQAALDSFAMVSGSCTKLTPDVLATIKLAETTGIESYAKAGLIGSIRKSFDIRIEGGYGLPLTGTGGTQTGMSLIEGAGTAAAPSVSGGVAYDNNFALTFVNSGCVHQTRQVLFMDRVVINNVSTGIGLMINPSLDSIRPDLTLDLVTMTVGTFGVNIDYNKRFSGHGPCQIKATNVTIAAGLSGPGSAIRVHGPTPQATVTDCTLVSDTGHGLSVSHMPGAAGMATGGTFAFVTNTDLSDCGQNGFHYENIDNASNFAHWEGATVTISLDKVRMLNCGANGARVRTFVNSSGGHFGGHIDFSAVNCVASNCGTDGIHLQGDFFNSHRTSRIDLNVVNCTLGENGGDGLHAVTSYDNTSDPNQVQDVHNTILSLNGGNGLESDDNINGSTSFNESFNNFFGNGAPAKLFQGVSVAPVGSDSLLDPLFSGLLPEPYQPLLTSPILDAGTNLFGAPSDDILGTGRPQGGGFSMGAYEEGVAPFLANGLANGSNPYTKAAPILVNFTSAPTGGSGVYTAFEWRDLDTNTVLSTLQNFPLNYTALDIGVHNIQITVTDDLGNQAIEVVVVTINPPLAITGSGTPAAGFEATGLNWNLISTPSGGTPPYTTFLWEDVNTLGVTFGTPAAQNTTADLNAVADNTPVTVRITVTDTDGNTAFFEFDIIRNTGNPVTASAVVSHVATSQSGSSVIVVEGETVVLDGTAGGGSGSYTFDWDEPQQPFTATTEDTSDTPAFPPNPAPLTYTFTVTDTFGLFATATVLVTVVDPIVPVPSATPSFIDLSLGPPSTTDLSVVITGGSPQAGGTYVSIDWIDLTNGNAAVGSGTTVPGYLPTIQPGLNTVQVTVTDNLGFTGTATLDIFVVESGMTVTAIGTYNIAGTSISGSALSIFAGDSVDLSSTVVGGSGSFAFAWTGPGGFASTQQNPGTVTPPAIAGVYVYTLTVTDTISGQVVVVDVTITSNDSINNQGLFVGNGKVKYKATTASTPEKGKDYAKIWLEGVVFNTGDRVAFDFNTRPIGDIAGGSSIVLDEKLKGSGQLGPLFGPNFFPKVTVKYKATRIRLDAKCLKGDFEPFAFGSPMTTNVTGLSPIVNVTVFVDRAPADGVVDDTIVLPLMFKVRATLNSSGVYTESGKKVAP